MSEGRIASLRVTPSAAQPGEPVLVEALGDDGQVLDNAGVAINGIRGARQFLQFDSAGEYRVVAVSGDGENGVSADLASVRVAEDGLAREVVPARFPILEARRPSAARAPYAVAFNARDTDAFTGLLDRAFGRDDADLESLTRSTSVISWAWDFGTGETIRTRSPEVVYDFEAHLAPDQEHQLFDVRCDLTLADGTTSTVTRTLSVVNAYAVCRARGVLAPPVTASPARKVLKAFQAGAVVRNVEAFPITLTARRFQWGEAETETVTGLEQLPDPIVIPEGATVTLSVGIGFEVVPADVRSFTVLWLGNDPDGRSVHVESTFDVPLPDHRSRGIRFGELAVTRMLAKGLTAVELAADVDPVVDPDRRLVVEELVRLRDGAGVGWAVGRRVGGEDGAVRRARRRAGGGEGGENLRLAGRADPRLWLDLPDRLAPFEPAEAAGAAGPIGDSLTTLLADDRLASLVIEGRAGARQPGLGRVRVSEGLLNVGGWAEAIRAGLTGPAEGRVCDPDNLPEDAGDDWACQIVPQPDGTPELIDWHRPARFVNARKGDLILAPGGPAGFIGGLLGQVVPSQRYAHMGIMTRNYDMITHCTFADDRLEAHPNGAIDLGPFGSEDAPTDGFEPDVLRYGWPGTITQWVGAATEPGESGGKLADPAAVADPTSVVPGAPVREVPAVDPDGDVYRLAPFDRYPKPSRSGESWQVVPPLVVKPNPALETTEVRQTLHRLADACRLDTGKTYYSFYAYTDAARALSDRSAVTDFWHEGNYPAVCSSFIWAVARRLGLQLEGPGGLARPQDLEVADQPAVEVGEGTPDGLYHYTAQERTAAAHWLHARVRGEVLDTVRKKVRDKIGDLGRLDDLLGDLIDDLSDMADDVANQMCNAFASDWCDTAAKDSEAWTSPGDGVAVSPDDTMRWDGPGGGGLFGYVVPAVYLPPVVERAPRYAWHYAPTKGAVHGVVRVDGAPRPGAIVQVNDAPWGVARTRSDGSYQLRRVPFGRYELKAQFDRGDGVFYTAKQLLDLQEADRVVDFDLTQPKEMNRLIAVSGSHYFMKYYTVGRNPRTEPAYPFAFSRGVTPSPDSMRSTAYTASDFHGIFGVSSFLFNWLQGGAVQWAVNWTVCQDSAVADQVAYALTDAVDALSFGFIPSLFGSEVKGQDLRTGVLNPGEWVADSIRIGPGDRSTGLLNFRLENRML